ncbi:MAG: RT0821/Lpp0805 family surface protein [Anaerolineales bacterium]|jgi:surface antigen|nr:RT0821/Lpp0805 family surface protein [Anaerolineales bacterium]|tara:strand:+ start:414 stop:884 length:471 start_codon:yes stop_codon:yes gene_type:complete
MKKLAIATVMSAALLTGCAGTYSKQDTGTAAGALLGGGLAYGLGQNSSNKEIWTVLGIGLGAMLGNQIGQQLDERDRLMMGQSFQTALERAPNNQSSSWNNPNTGNSGYTTPTRTVVASNGTPCREFTQTVIIGGQSQQAYGTACRQADGSWKIQQ